MLEQAGIATVSISHLPEITQKVGAPRAAHLKFPLGRAFGPAGRPDLQRRILLDCLTLLEAAEQPGQIVPLPYRWRRD
ncbi:MAG TPA: hypothetical protein VD969_09825 [Symbiobacteriaceae bacterium]|nr:hypothetical protein [Symbiobacteriaceae bacterium]